MFRRPDRTERSARRSKPRRLVLESLEVRDLLSGFTVTTTADNGSNSNPTAGSLRAAIIAADNAPVVGGNTISFSIGSGTQTIALTAPLPSITGTTVIDGATQPGYNSSPLIVLDGSNAGSGSNGLTFTGGTSSLVRGLSIVGFSTTNGQGGAGIVVEGTATSTTIESNYIGVGANGSSAQGNTNGIVIETANNTIGGATSPMGNVISGNTNAGLLLVGSTTTGNIVEANQIGTNAGASSALGNTYGVFVTASNNVIGGTSAGAANVISGNVGSNTTTGVGIIFEGAPTGDVVEGNKIGTNFSGTAAIGNSYGITLGTPPSGSSTDSISNLTIGGTVAGAGNLISGNFIGITGFGTKTQNVLIAGNTVGLDATGATPLPNGTGIELYLFNSTIGGTTTGSGNVISGNNTGTGLILNGVADLIEGNDVGTTASGNGGIGIGNAVGMQLNIDSSTIGGTASGAGNVISGNTGDAIDLTGSGMVGIFGNIIGETAGGASLANGGNGISLTIPPPTGNPSTTPLTLNDTIGGTAAGAGNTISGSGGAGILVTSNDPTGYTGLGIRGNVIKGNAKLGIDLLGTGVPELSTQFITGSTVANGQVTVSGVMFGTPSTAFSLDLFANAADPSGYGQGPVYLGPVSVTTNASGFATFSSTYAEPSTPYTSFTATATGPRGNTTEFSANDPLISSIPTADVSVTETTINNASTTVTAGTPFTLTETVVNNGPNTANGVVLYDTLPTSLINTSVVTTVGTASFDSNNLLTAQLGTLTSGESVTITITATATAAGNFTDTPGVGSQTFDTNYADNTSSQVITVNPANSGPLADLGVSETASTPAVVGSNLTYTVTVTNNGPNTSTNSIINDFLPTGVTFVGASASQGATPTSSSGFLTDNLGSIEPGATATLTIVVKPTAAGSIINSANVSGNQFDPNKANNSTSLTTTVTSPAPRINLILSQSVYPQTGYPGQNEIFTMTVTNHGPDAATNVTLIDALPAGATFINAAPTQGGFASLVNGVITDNFGTVAAGASATLTLVLQPTAPGFYLNYAGAYSADQPSLPFSFAYGAVSVPSGPSVVGVAKTNGNTQMVVAFDETLKASTATNKANYQLVSLGTTGSGPRKTIAIKAVSYNSANNLVTITPSTPLNPAVYYQLVVVGSSKNGIADPFGRRLVNPQYTTPGANYSLTFYAGTLATY